MSIIEQAARRLEELKRAGVQVAWEPAATPESSAASAAMPGRPAAPRVALHEEQGYSEQGYSLDLDDDDVPSPAPARSSARGRAAHSAAGHALVRVGLRQSKSVELDLLKLSEMGYLVPGAPRSVLVDEFRGIKQPVLKNVRGEAAQAGSHANLIMITSALAGEGKTFCSLNLALSIASEVDSSVLLVDADVLRPSVMTRLGVQGHHKGLLDLLSDTTLELPELILKTNIPKLSVLPAGAPTSQSTELLASDALRELLHEIATRYPERIVIFDSPPLLSTTESRVLAARMGQIIMVVSAGTTAELDIKQAFTALEHCTTVLCLLNRSSNDSDQRHYGYYAQ